MSTLVDERVVEMKFDNRNFEKNTRHTMATIQRLKSSLNFSNVTNSVNKSVSSMDFNPISSGLEKVSTSFSAWEVASITAISNVTDRIVNLGIQLVESLSVDNVKAGWDKFTQQTKTTGTIISQLSNIMEKSEAGQITSDYMKKVQYYSDMTSYSLTDMTDAMSKFISKGQDMDTSFKASVGIANWAATAGKNAQEAQIAFNALSKVADHVLSRQWTSIQLGTMDTIEFKQAVLEAAAEVGTLTKSQERLDGTIEYITKKGNLVTVSNFADNFADAWFDTETLMKVLGKYGYAVQEVMDLNDELGRDTTPYEALDIYKEKMENLAKTAKETGDAEALAKAETALFSAKALDAASEARTLTDAINAVKDAVSTGWLTGFQKIFGEYSQATEFFSELSDVLANVFTAPTKAINDALDRWTKLSGREDLFGLKRTLEDGTVVEQGAFWNITDALRSFISTVKEAWKEIFPFNKSLKDITESIKEFSSKILNSVKNNSTNIKNIFRGLFSILKLGLKIFEGIKIAVKPLFDLIIGNSGTFIKFIGDIADKFANWVNETTIFSNIGGRVAKVFETIINTLKELKVVDKVIETFKSLKEELQVSDALNNAWKSIVDTFDSLFDLLLQGIKGILTFSVKYIIPAIGYIIKALGPLLALIGNALLNGLKLLLDSVRKFIEFIKGNETIQNLWNDFITFMQSIPSRLKKLEPFFKKLGTAISNFFAAVWNGIKTLGNGIAVTLQLNSFAEVFAIIGEKISYGFHKIVEGIKSLASPETEEAVDGVQKKLSPLQTFFKGVIDLFKGVWAVIKALIPFIGKFLSAVGTLFQSIADGINNTFNNDVKGLNIDLKTILGGGLLALIAKGLYDFVWLFKGITLSISEVLLGLGNVFKAKAAMMWAEAIKTIAIAMLMLVASILIITMIDPNKLWNAVAVLSTIMGALTAVIVVMGIFMKTTYKSSSSWLSAKNLLIGKGGSFKREGTGFSGVAAMILAMGLSVLALVAALKIIESIDPKKVWQDLGILALVMGALAASIGLMNLLSNIGSKATKGTKGVRGLLGFALAVLLLTVPIRIFGEMPIETLLKGIASIAALAISFGFMIRIMHGFKAKGVAKMAVFAAAITALVVPIQTLGTIEQSTLITGVAVISTISLVYGIMARLSSKMKLTAAVSFLAIISIFMYALNNITTLLSSTTINSISWESIGKLGVILVSLFAVIVSLIAAVDTITLNKKIFVNIAIFASVLALLLGSMYGMIFAVKLIDNLNPMSVIATLGVIASIIAGTSAVLVASKKIIKDTRQIKPLIKKLILFGSVMLFLTSIVGLMGLCASTFNDVNIVSLIESLVMLGIMIGATVGVIAISKKIKIDNKTLSNLATLSLMMIMILSATYIMAEIAEKMKNIDIPAIGKALLLLASTLLISIVTVVAASKFSSKIKKVASSLLMLGASFTLFSVGVLLLSKALNELWDKIKIIVVLAGIVVALAVVMKVLGPAFTAISVPVLAFGVGILAIGAGIYLVVAAIKTLLPLLDEITEKGDKISTAITTVLQAVILGVANTLPLLIDTVIEAIIMLFNKLTDNIDEIIDSALLFLDALLNKMFSQETINKMADIVQTAIGDVFKALLNRIKTNPEFLGPGALILKALIEAIVGEEDPYDNPFVNFFREMFLNIKNTIDDIIETFKGFWNKLKEAFSTGNWASFGEWWNNFWNGLFNKKQDEKDRDYRAYQPGGSKSPFIDNPFKSSLQDNYTIIPVVDLSNFEKGLNDINLMMGSIDNNALSPTISNAKQLSSDINNARQLNTQNTLDNSLATSQNNQNGTYNVTFNITGSDPKAIADEVSKRFSQEITRRNTKWA